MKRNKRGISLIVLVITIIVMIVLAATVIITLDNSGIIGKANEAVKTGNIKQIQNLANLIWAEAFLDENVKTDEKYEEYVKDKLEDNNINLKDYYIEITANGIILEGPDTAQPTLTIASNKESVKAGNYDYGVIHVRDNGNASSAYYYGTDLGVRPVVCLSADIPAKSVGTTGYEI